MTSGQGMSERGGVRRILRAVGLAIGLTWAAIAQAAPGDDLARSMIYAERLLDGEDADLSREHVFALERSLWDAAERLRRSDPAAFRALADGSRDNVYKRLNLRLAQLALLVNAPGAATQYLDVDAALVQPADRASNVRFRAAALVLDGRPKEARGLLAGLKGARQAPCFGSGPCGGFEETADCGRFSGEAWPAVMASAGPTGACAARALTRAAELFLARERDDLAESFLRAALFATETSDPTRDDLIEARIAASDVLVELLTAQGRRPEAQALVAEMVRVGSRGQLGEMHLMMARQHLDLADGEFPPEGRLMMADRLIAESGTSGLPRGFQSGRERLQVMWRYQEKARAEFALKRYVSAYSSNAMALRYVLGQEAGGRPWQEPAIRLAASARASTLFAERALIAEALGDFPEALRLTAYSHTVLNNWLRQNWATPAAVSGLLSGRRKTDGDVLAMLGRIHARGGPLQSQAAALAFSTAQLLQYSQADGVLRAAAVRGAIADPATRMAIQDREQLAELRRRARVNAPAQVEALSAKIDALDRSLPTPLVGFERQASFSLVDLAAAQALLSPREAVLMIVTLSDRTEVMVVTPEATDWRTLRRPEAWVRARVQRIQTFLRSPVGGRAAFDRPSAVELYRDLLQPFEAQLGDRLLLVSASGPLAPFPLGVLVTGPGDQGVWLAQKHAVVVTSSIASLQAVRLAERPRRRVVLIAIGDPKLDTDGLAADGPRLTPLRFAGEEIRRLSAAAGGGPVTVMTGAQATKAAVRKADLTSVGVLEFATHAIQPGDSAAVEEAALVLSPYPGMAPADHYLTSSDVAALRVGANLVLLSACETANSLEADEAVSGLAAAFLLAGARGVVATRWPVADEAALRLVGEGLGAPFAGGPDSFAEGLRRRIDALVREDPQGRSGDPRFWGAFMVAGG